MKLYQIIIATAAFCLMPAMYADASSFCQTGKPRQYSLQNSTNVNTTAIEKSIAEAEALLENADNYLPGLVADLEDALVNAHQVLDCGGTQSQISKANTRLKDAIAKMKASAGKTFDSTAPDAVYDIERGFLHPGGLHTQADFDRVKWLLKQGNQKVTDAVKTLRNDQYSQSSYSTSPTELIKRGVAGDENYMNAARAAAAAYQNALRWKIDGTKANADNAVRILNSWARTTKGVTGNTNAALALGIYGYEFAQAAELMRDYEGWKEKDFQTYRKWMLQVWYPGIIGFLRGRFGTWENSGKWWQAPGHYWSNWGLCNALALMTIGVLCDDVFIYNQALSFIKYDQVGTFTDPRTTNPILDDGLNEFWGNLIVTTTESELETGAYGKLGQMQESGRDIGHVTMACGLAVDIAHMAYNQGDDLFAYMDNRLAAGVEYIAAQVQSIPNLPWTNYHYCTSGFHFSDSRSQLMTEPALGEQIRPYWGTIIGHYESVKGVKMPLSDVVYEKMGIDRGGQGGTSGGYDHLGYSVLMNTHEYQLAPADSIPTQIFPQMEYNGQIIDHNELGGLTNTYVVDTNKAEARENTVKLMPQLENGAEDSGNWKWNTGETTKDITVTTDKSFAYRVTYTNQKGVKSYQIFTIAVDADCNPSAETKGTIKYKGITTETDSITVFYDETVTLGINGCGGYESYEWDNGETSNTITTNPIVRPRDFTGVYINQGGVRMPVKFHVDVKYMEIQAKVNGVLYKDTLSLTVNAGDKVEIGPYVPTGLAGNKFEWNTGAKTSTIVIDNIVTSGVYVLDYEVNGEKGQLTYTILVNATEDSNVAEGDYFVVDRLHGTLLTNNGQNKACTMQPKAEGEDLKAQIWHITNNGQGYHNFQSQKEGLYLQVSAKTTTVEQKFVLGLRNAVGSDYYEIHNKRLLYWTFGEDGSIIYNKSTEPSAYPLVFEPYNDETGISLPTSADGKNLDAIYNMMGQKLSEPRKGINIINGRKVIVK